MLHIRLTTTIVDRLDIDYGRLQTQALLHWRKCQMNRGEGAITPSYLKSCERVYRMLTETSTWTASTLLDQLEQLKPQAYIIFEQLLQTNIYVRIAEHKQKEVIPEYTLLVSNVGWVVSSSDPRRFSHDTVKALFDEYVASGTYEQVSLWSTQQDDPLEMHDTTKGEEGGEEQ